MGARGDMAWHAGSYLDSRVDPASRARESSDAPDPSAFRGACRGVPRVSVLDVLFCLLCCESVLELCEVCGCVGVGCRNGGPVLLYLWI